MKMTIFAMQSKRLACQFGIGCIAVLSVTVGQIPGARADVSKPVGVLVQNPSTGNDCLAGTCTAHAPVPFNGKMSIPYTATRSFPSGDHFQIDGVISISENADGTQLPGTMSFTITFISGGGIGGTSQGVPDVFVLHNFLDYTPNGNANDLNVVAMGTFSAGVGSDSNVSVSAQYCGSVNSAVVGPISPPPKVFNQSTETFVAACASELLVDTTYTINFQSGTKPGAYIQVGNISIPSLVDTHDLNGGGMSDILFRNSSSGGLLGWLMNGNSIAGTGTIATVPTSWQLVAQRDFDGDGKTDLLWRNTTTGAVGLWLMNDLGIKKTLVVGTVPTHWVIAGASDFNHDGKADILWRDTNTGAVAIWLMDGGTVMQTGTVTTVPLSWSIIGTNPNGGIAWHNTSGALSLWKMSGFAVASSHVVGTVPSVWNVVGVGDFDGDGSDDLLLRNGSTGALAMWFIVNGTVTRTASVATVPAAWSVSLTGDFDGDGKSDILWTNTNGARAIWFMNSEFVDSKSTISTLSTVWVVQSNSAE